MVYELWRRSGIELEEEKYGVSYFKGKIIVCFRNQPDMTRYFDSVDKFLENKVGGDRLWDEIPKVMVTDRTI